MSRINVIERYYTVRIVLRSNRKIVETEVRSTPLTHIHMTVYFPVLVLVPLTHIHMTAYFP